MLSPEKLEVFSHSPVQALYEMAREVCLRNPGSFSELEDAVQKMEAAARESDTLEHIQEIARDNYVDSNCDIDIDHCCLAHHNGSSGYWVGAWLYVSDEEAEAETEIIDTVG